MKQGEESSTKSISTAAAYYYGATHLQVSALTQKTRTLTQCRPHVCSVCEKSFTTKYGLNVHYRIHTGELPFPCSYCPRSFRTEFQRVGHEMIHRGDRPFACSFCPKSYCTNTRLTRHIRLIHAKIRGYSCPECQKSFQGSEHLNWHRRRFHNLENPFICTFNGCGEKCRSRQYLDRHLKYHHGILLPYECSKCDQRFKKKTELLCHEGIHYRRDQGIEAIKWTFSQQSDQEQQSVHDQCGNSTRSSVQKNGGNSKSNKENAIQKKKKKKQGKEEKEMQLMERKENYQEDNSSYYGYCSCGRTFSSRVKFRRHRNRKGHSRAKVHECPICLMTFKTIKGLELHYYSHDPVTRKSFEKSGHRS